MILKFLKALQYLIKTLTVVGILSLRSYYLSRLKKTYVQYFIFFITVTSNDVTADIKQLSDTFYPND